MDSAYIDGQTIIELRKLRRKRIRQQARMEEGGAERKQQEKKNIANERTNELSKKGRKNGIKL